MALSPQLRSAGITRCALPIELLRQRPEALREKFAEGPTSFVTIWSGNQLKVSGAGFKGDRARGRSRGAHRRDQRIRDAAQGLDRDQAGRGAGPAGARDWLVVGSTIPTFN